MRQWTPLDFVTLGSIIIKTQPLPDPVHVRRFKNVQVAWTNVSTPKQFGENVPLLLHHPAQLRMLNIHSLAQPLDIRYSLPHEWECSGCGWRTNMKVGACKGYCMDASGKSCDAVPCPRCKKFHFWTGSMAYVHWVLISGQVSQQAQPCDLSWILSILKQCRRADVPAYVISIGSNPVITTEKTLSREEAIQYGADKELVPEEYQLYFPSRRYEAVIQDIRETVRPRSTEPYLVNDGRGADWSEWPEALRVRQTPEVSSGI